MKPTPLASLNHFTVPVSVVVSRREQLCRILSTSGDSSEGGPAVMYLDLDGFKRVNDELGHHAGDELLRAVARRLKRTFRQGETIARVGGDEFAVIVEHASFPSRTRPGRRGALRPRPEIGRGQHNPLAGVGEHLPFRNGHDAFAAIRKRFENACVAGSWLQPEVLFKRLA